MQGKRQASKAESIESISEAVVNGVGFAGIVAASLRGKGDNVHASRGPIEAWELHKVDQRRQGSRSPPPLHRMVVGNEEREERRRCSLCARRRRRRREEKKKKEKDGSREVWAIPVRFESVWSKSIIWPDFA
ncbi:hypothetical protein JCGZ_01404 [Jatropha curcas]|uniref:Uncharacterized protein n=1 Tax=Jatropha curcas TaxID=180498 RepID=A0A067LKN7_JATCU|nr:hypothetical protein JCGZ_01404 [Jatropha curcas]